MDLAYSWAFSDGLKPSLRKHAAYHGPFKIFAEADMLHCQASNPYQLSNKEIMSLNQGVSDSFVSSTEYWCPFATYRSTGSVSFGKIHRAAPDSPHPSLGIIADTVPSKGAVLWATLCKAAYAHTRTPSTSLARTLQQTVASAGQQLSSKRLSRALHTLPGAPLAPAGISTYKQADPYRKMHH